MRARPSWPSPGAPWPGAAACPRAPGPTYRARQRPGGSSAADATTQVSGTSALNTRQGAAAKGFARANSIPFPVAVGNTWIYQTISGGRPAAPRTGSSGRRLARTGTGSRCPRPPTSAGLPAPSVRYTFYLDGTIGYPVPPVSGVPVTGGSVRWPDAAGLASGKAYHSVLRIQGGNADVTVQGAGMARSASRRAPTAPAW